MNCKNKYILSLSYILKGQWSNFPEKEKIHRILQNAENTCAVENYRIIPIR